MRDVLTTYETELSLLLKRLGQEHPRYTEALVLQSRLWENLARARLYGDTKTTHAERAQIIDTLNHLALETTGEPFIAASSGAVRFVRKADGTLVFLGSAKEPHIIGDTGLIGRVTNDEARNQFHRMKDLFEQEAVTAHKRGNSQIEALSLQYLGLALIRLADIEHDQRQAYLSRAADTLRQAVELFETMADPSIRARTRYHLGRCYVQLGRWDQATTVLEQARETFTRQKTRPELAHTLLELGQLYGQMQDFESANIYLKDALRLFRRLGDTDGIAVTREALGNLALQTARPSEAIEVLEKARQGYETLGRRERVRSVDELLDMARQARQVSERIGATL